MFHNNVLSKTDHTGALFLQYCWTESAMRDSDLDPSQRYHQAAVDKHIYRLQYLMDYKIGFENQPSPESFAAQHTYPKLPITTDVHRYALFPVVRSDGRMEPWVAVCSTRAPDPRYVDFTAGGGASVIDVPGIKARVYRTNTGSNKSAILAMLSAAACMKQYIQNTFANADLIHIWVTHMHDSSHAGDGFQYVTGASMGLAVCAAILGLVPVMYTGYVKEFDVIDRYIGQEHEHQHRLTQGGSHLQLYPLLNPDDDVKDVREMPLKLMLGLFTGCPLVCPHAKLFSGSYERLGALITLANEVRNYNYAWAQAPEVLDVDMGLDQNMTSYLSDIVRKIFSTRKLDPGALNLRDPNAWNSLVSHLGSVMMLETTYPGTILNIRNKLVNLGIRDYFRTSQSCLANEVLPYRVPFYLATSASELPIISQFISLQMEEKMPDKARMVDAVSTIVRNRDEQYAPQSAMRSLRTKLSRKKASDEEKAVAKKLTAEIRKSKEDKKDDHKRKKKEIRKGLTKAKDIRRKEKEDRTYALASDKHKARIDKRRQERGNGNVSVDAVTAPVPLPDTPVNVSNVDIGQNATDQTQLETTSGIHIPPRYEKGNLKSSVWDTRRSMGDRSERARMDRRGAALSQMRSQSGAGMLDDDEPEPIISI